MKDMTDKQVQHAIEAARILRIAYEDGEANGGSIDWETLDQAYEEAMKAFCKCSTCRYDVFRDYAVPQVRCISKY